MRKSFCIFLLSLVIFRFPNRAIKNKREEKCYERGFANLPVEEYAGKLSWRLEGITSLCKGK